jgi:hypothetical protein
MARQAIAVPNYILNSLIGQRLAAAVPSARLSRRFSTKP